MRFFYKGGKFGLKKGTLSDRAADVLRTRKNTRVLRPGYGSDLPDLVDRPMNADLVPDIYIAVAETVVNFLPEVELNRINVDKAAPGFIEVSVNEGDFSVRVEG
jgi:uncharacterized protein